MAIGFWIGISGTIEHTEILTYVINHTRNYQRNLIIALLDLKNAFSKLDQQVIIPVLCYHHGLDHISSLVGLFYANYSISIGTTDFIANPIVVEKGALQGDVSFHLFLTCASIHWKEQ